MESRNPEMRQAVDLLRLAAPTRLPILITGPTGTGKELAARAVHAASGRTGPFVGVNVAAVPGDLFEDEMFGHERGAFTGAIGRRMGAISRAARGTLLLDEVGELDPHLQAKLLRFLQDGVYTPLGSDVPCPSDVRLIAATHRDLPGMVLAGSFREDLLHRLAFVPVRLPSLAARMVDLPALIASTAAELSFDPEWLGADAVAALLEYDFPGNIRELRTILMRLRLLSHAPRTSDVRTACLGTQRATAQTLEASSEDAIREAMQQTGGSAAEAARLLGIHRSTVYRHRVTAPSR